jgi:hypothetical protein
MNYLAAKHGGNIHNKGIVETRSSSRDKDYFHEKNIVDLTADTKFRRQGEPEQWIQFDFKSM